MHSLLSTHRGIARVKEFGLGASRSWKLRLLITLIPALTFGALSFFSITDAQASYTFSGTLTDSADSPISNALITLTATDGNTSSAVTTSNGSYSISAVPDTYSLSVVNNTNKPVDSDLSGYSVQQNGTPLLT
jgi:hypothetical protein